MPRYYQKRRSYSYAKKKTSTKRAKAQPRRRSYARKKYGGKLSTKRILNMTSEKKRDKMMTYTNVTQSAQTGSGTFNATPAIITGGSSPFVSVWCATARDNTTSTTGRIGNKFDVATRTASNCYMVGLKESIEIQIADGLPWQWRRICFTYKGGSTAGGNLPIPTSSYYPSLETSSGWVRVVNGITTAQQATFFGLLFQGTQNTDWSDTLTAKLDNERITVKYDKTISIMSGNEDGVIRRYNRWHPMKHNLMYDDDEAGGTTGAQGYSVDSKRGMGDYWVIDIIKPRVGSSASNQLLFNTEATLYWHEK
uniref:Capsid protein n=1 Tax=Ficedula parva Genomoviridae sp. TaxID=2814952 RepID=A0A8A4XCR1_9VIRU|nr:MAG: capsid protein [Gemycircularvirus]